MNVSWTHLSGLRLAVLLVLISASARSEEASSLMIARNSIEASQLRRHVSHLADDLFEGREAGSRGGRPGDRGGSF